MPASPRLAWALRLAELGWPVFPLLPGAKRPAISQWEQRATRDPGRITTFWTAHPTHNIGLPCGPAGLLVVDLDMPGHTRTGQDDERRRGQPCGAQVLTRLADRTGHPLPDTFTVTTPTGGTHLYFAQPPGTALHNSQGKLGPLVDTRGHGGYVVAPGSTTVDGSYHVASQTAPAVLPVWLARLLADRPCAAISAPRQIAADGLSRWLAAAVEGESRRAREAPPGGHNKAQAIAAYNLGRLVGGGHLTHPDAAALLSSAVAGHVAGPCGCTQRGVGKVIAWGLEAGARNPRHINTGRTVA